MPPPRAGITGEPLALFQVQSNPGVQELVEVVVAPETALEGVTTKALRPSGTRPSLAYFDDLILYQRELQTRGNLLSPCCAFCGRRWLEGLPAQRAAHLALSVAACAFVSGLISHLGKEQGDRDAAVCVRRLRYCCR